MEGAVMLKNRGLNLATLIVAFAARSQAADAPKERENAAAALARYVAGGQTVEWAIESMELRASLPKLAKTGRLQAIRRLAPSHQAKYEVLLLTGDRTVKEQVIARYLKAEQQASEIPAASVAIIPANYKFSYKGATTNAGRLAYVFQLSPRKKRDGLIKGEFWLDAETAAPLRYSGYLVKRPSLFVKRVEVTRESEISEGVVEARRTYLTVDTRLVGRAELAIEERPLKSAETAELTNAGSGGGQQ
jgi:hypothetical protein